MLRHTDAEPEWLARLDRDAHVELMNPRMNSGHLQGRLLKMLVELINPDLALEVGTFGGYAAQCIAEGMSETSRLITIEKDDELEPFIRRHLVESSVASKIELRIGDALEILPSLSAEFGLGKFGFIFLDADKRLYPRFYECVITLLKPGGLLVADNVLWDGHVTETDRHDGMTEGVREFNDMVAADIRVEKVMIPVRDGLLLIRRKVGS